MHLHTLGHHVLLATVETGRGGLPVHGRVEPVGHRETVVRLSWGQCGNRFRAAGYRPWARWGGGPRSGDSRARRTAGVQLCAPRCPVPSLPVQNALSGQVEFPNISRRGRGRAIEPPPKRGAKLAVAIGPLPPTRPARPARRPAVAGPRRPVPARAVEAGALAAPALRPAPPVAAPPPAAAADPYGRKRKSGHAEGGGAPHRRRPLPPGNPGPAAAGEGRGRGGRLRFGRCFPVSGCRCPGSPPPRGPPPGGRRGCGTASRRRSPGPPRGRSARTPGRRRAHRRHRA